MAETIIWQHDVPVGVTVRSRLQSMEDGSYTILVSANTEDDNLYYVHVPIMVGDVYKTYRIYCRRIEDGVELMFVSAEEV
jgi:hypothetical protein